MKILHITGMPSTKYGSVERFFIAQMKANPEDTFLLQYESKPSSDTYVADLQLNRGGIWF